MKTEKIKWPLFFIICFIWIILGVIFCIGYVVCQVESKRNCPLTEINSLFVLKPNS